MINFFLNLDLRTPNFICMWPIQNLNLPSNLLSHPSIIFTPSLSEHVAFLHVDLSPLVSLDREPALGFHYLLASVGFVGGHTYFKECSNHHMSSFEWSQGEPRHKTVSQVWEEAWAIWSWTWGICKVPWLADLASLQVDSLILGDALVPLFLRFHGLLDTVEKSAPVDSRAHLRQPRRRRPPCSRLPPPKPSHTPSVMSAFPLLHMTSPREPAGAWGHLFLGSSPALLLRSVHPPPLCQVFAALWEPPSWHRPVPGLLPIWLLPVRPPPSGSHRGHGTWVHAFCLPWPGFELDHNPGMSVWLWHNTPAHVATADLCSIAHLPSECFCGWRY